MHAHGSANRSEISVLRQQPSFLQGSHESLDRHPNPPGFVKAVLYADAVVGWSWIYFKDYDFENNPLGFSKRILPILRQSGEAMKELACADAVGIDFHKAGWAPYISSCFLYRDAEAFEQLLRRGGDAYLQIRNPYNPMYYTLEVSAPPPVPSPAGRP